MSQTMPNCRRCGRPYTTPGGGGYCEDHRQFPLCTLCGGSGWDREWARCCYRCRGTRHEAEPRADFVHVDVPVEPVTAPPAVVDPVTYVIRRSPPRPEIDIDHLRRELAGLGLGRRCTRERGPKERAARVELRSNLRWSQPWRRGGGE